MIGTAIMGTAISILICIIWLMLGEIIYEKYVFKLYYVDNHPVDFVMFLVMWITIYILVGGIILYKLNI